VRADKRRTERLRVAVAVAATLTIAALAVLALLACRRVRVLPAILDGQPSRNPRHWWHLRQHRAP
jgi:hypothetical protein